MISIEQNVFTQWQKRTVLKIINFSIALTKTSDDVLFLEGNSRNKIKKNSMWGGQGVESTTVG